VPDAPAEGDKAAETTPDGSHQTDWTAAATQVRSAAAWIVKAFAALGVALVGTSPLLVDLGNLGLNARSVVAVLGAVVALAAIAVIIGAATDVNLTQVTDIVDLTEPSDGATRAVIHRVEGSPAARELYLAGAGDVDGVLALRRTYQSVHSTQLALLAGMTTDADRATISTIADATLASLAGIDSAISNLQGWVTYQRIRRRFDDSRVKMFVAGAVAVLGVAVWLTALGIDISKPTSPDSGSASPGTVATAQGSVGTLVWTRTGSGQRAATSLRAQLGLAKPACDAASVLVAGGSGDPIDPWQVSVLPRQRCLPPPGLGSFTVDRRLATFTALDPAAGPSATVTIASSGSGLSTAGWVLIVLAAALVTGGLTWYLTRRLTRAAPSAA
jgi:hypothetical protein